MKEDYSFDNFIKDETDKASIQNWCKLFNIPFLENIETIDIPEEKNVVCDIYDIDHTQKVVKIGNILIEGKPTLCWGFIFTNNQAFLIKSIDIMTRSHINIIKNLWLYLNIGKI